MNSHRRGFVPVTISEHNEIVFPAITCETPVNRFNLLTRLPFSWKYFLRDLMDMLKLGVLDWKINDVVELVVPEDFPRWAFFE